ncbi:MAG TPA: DedA family protein [Acidimicrobiales bacterium]|nr:DedA family protein [Acidimicrobiales bacterium]
MNIHHLLVTYGYAAVFVFVAVESLGIPLPGETILIAAGTYAGSTHRLSVALIFFVAAAAAILGDNAGYFIGNKGGYRLLHRYGRYIRLEEPKVKVGRYVFDRHGGKVVFFGRFVSVLRTYAAFLAGTLRMRWLKFLVFNAAGGILWAAIYSFASYYAGHALTKASGTVDIVIGVLAVVIIVGFLVIVRRQSARLTERAEAAYPGPLPDH